MNRHMSIAAATGLAALLLVLSDPSLRAQIPTGEITGTVTDPSGALFPAPHHTASSLDQ